MKHVTGHVGLSFALGGSRLKPAHRASFGGFSNHQLKLAADGEPAEAGIRSAASRILPVGGPLAITHAGKESLGTFGDIRCQPSIH